MTPPVRRPLLAVDDPLQVARPLAPEAPAGSDASGATSGTRKRTVERRALFVRLRVEEADAVARAAFELGVHKQDLIGALVRRYVDARTPEGLATMREVLRRY